MEHAASTGSPRTDHVALIFPSARLMVHPYSLGSFKNWSACEEACKALRVLGHTDWRLASRPEWERYVLDFEHFNSAVDPSLYPNIKPHWHWTSTGCAWNRDAAGVSPSAWGVNAYNGFADGKLRNYSGFALAVRRMSAEEVRSCR